MQSAFLHNSLNCINLNCTNLALVPQLSLLQLQPSTQSPQKPRTLRLLSSQPRQGDSRSLHPPVLATDPCPTVHRAPRRHRHCRPQSRPSRPIYALWRTEGNCSLHLKKSGLGPTTCKQPRSRKTLQFLVVYSTLFLFCRFLICIETHFRQRVFIFLEALGESLHIDLITPVILLVRHNRQKGAKRKLYC